MIDERAIRERYEAIRDQLDERGRRLFAAAEARSAGRGAWWRCTTRRALPRPPGNRSGARHHRAGAEGSRPARAARRAGPPGRERAAAPDNQGSNVAGGSASPGRAGHAGRSDATTAVGLQEPRQARQSAPGDGGHTLSPNTVRKLLRQLGYGRRANRKANDGRQHADRDAQFKHINARVLAFQADEQPVISVDTKKKELVGNYTNKGTEYRPEGQPRRTEVHDFEDKELGKV